MRAVLICFFSVIFLISSAKCANILSIFNTPSKSHTILGKKLAEGLVKRGHKVTIVTPFDVEPMDNLTHIPLKSIIEFTEKLAQDKGLKDMNKVKMFFHMLNFTKSIQQLFWSDPAIQKLIKEKPKYDAVITVNFMNDATLGLAHHLEVPSILFSLVGATILGNKYAANPHMVYVPNVFASADTDSFLGRFFTVTMNGLIEVIFGYVVDPIQRELLQTYLPNPPTLEELRNNVSLMLMNSHVSIEPARPYVPSMVQIGGFHLDAQNELPNDIKTYLDNAKHGAILFSLGSNVQISFLDQSKQEAIFKVLGELAPIKVLLKSDLEHKSAPSNILVKKWLPQADILGHPNIKVFISHGGLGGNTESVYHGVPILGIPFFGDQKMNLQQAVLSGYAEVLEKEEITEEAFRNKLKLLLEDPKYLHNAKKRSALIKEQPVKPMDNAAFWIEHIIKYGGGSHLRNAGMDLTWYQLYMFDVYVTYTVILFVAILINYYILKLSIRFVKKLLCKSSAKVKTN